MKLHRFGNRRFELDTRAFVRETETLNEMWQQTETLKVLTRLLDV